MGSDWPDQLIRTLGLEAGGQPMTITTTLAPEIAAELPLEPYPGLRPFEPHEWAIFFGREPMTDEVIARLAKQHFVVVHGASGSGKSSLVRAGVLPWLGLDHARSGKPWKTAVTRPSGGPLRNIARELALQLGPPPGIGSSADAAAEWHDRLALGSAVLADIDRALAAQDHASLCLLIDQFEELFRYAREQSLEEARLLVEILNAVAEPARAPRGFFVILTMRSDYLGECARFEGFAEAVNSSQYLLPRMDDFALLRADPRARHALWRPDRPGGRRPPSLRRSGGGGRASRAPARPHARLRPRPHAPWVERGMDRHPRRP